MLVRAGAEVQHDGVIEVEVDPAGLGRSRFAVSPLAEVTNALEVLVHPSRAPYARRWVAEVAQRLVWTDYDVLLAVTERATWYVPDFLAPIPPRPDVDIGEEAATVAATPAEQVRRELDLAFGTDPGPPDDVARVVATRGPEGLAALLARQLMRFWECELAGLWPSMRAVLEDDVDQRVIAAGRAGFDTVVGGLHPDVRWDGGCITIASSTQVRCDGTCGVVFLPSVYLPRPAVWAGPAGTAMIGYPATGRGRVWVREHEATRRARTGDGGDLLAGRWADLLSDLDVARSTSELAVRHGISASTASYHVRRLHGAGLVTRRRAGHRVLYQRTARAADTLRVLGVG